MNLKPLSALLVSAYLALGLSASEPLRIVGSDLFGSAVHNALFAEAAYNGWELDISFDGTLAASKAFEAGEADVAILALPDESPPTSAALAWPIGFEVSALVVNTANPLREVSLAQLRALFAQPATNEATLWEVAGGTGTWSARPVGFHAVRDRDHLHLEMFRSLVLAPRETRYDLRYWATPEEMIDQVAEENASIGLVPAGAEHPQVRTLFVSLEEDSQAYSPTDQSVFYGDYPLRLAFYVVVRAGAEAEAADVLRFLFSDTMARMIEQAGYMPVPSTERRQFEMDLEFGN